MEIDWKKNDKNSVTSNLCPPARKGVGITSVPDKAQSQQSDSLLSALPKEKPLPPALAHDNQQQIHLSPFRNYTIQDSSNLPYKTIVHTWQQSINNFFCH